MQFENVRKWLNINWLIGINLFSKSKNDCVMEQKNLFFAITFYSLDQIF